MFELLRAYYDDVSRAQFLADLAKKDDVILLRDRAGRQIQGFSTLVTVTVRQNGGTCRGVFSGDTVLEKAFWGQRVLGRAFLRYLFWKKLSRPLTPLYWLLISKGYKTYLMMANNFADYDPRYERPTPPDRQALMESFYRALYGPEYDAASHLIRPASAACHLKAGVAAISPALLAENRKVAFFQQANPDWEKGVELACIARMTLRMPFRYALKSFLVDRLLGPLRRLQVSLTAGAWKREGRKRGVR